VRSVPLVERSAVRGEGRGNVELPGGAKTDLRIGGRIEFGVHGGNRKHTAERSPPASI
jgi:hypothetical protein